MKFGIILTLIIFSLNLLAEESISVVRTYRLADAMANGLAIEFAKEPLVENHEKYKRLPLEIADYYFLANEKESDGPFTISQLKEISLNKKYPFMGKVIQNFINSLSEQRNKTILLQDKESDKVKTFLALAEKMNQKWSLQAAEHVWSQGFKDICEEADTCDNKKTPRNPTQEECLIGRETLAFLRVFQVATQKSVYIVEEARGLALEHKDQGKKMKKEMIEDMILLEFIAAKMEMRGSLQYHINNDFKVCAKYGNKSIYELSDNICKTKFSLHCKASRITSD